jgi:hypothetical protein
LGLGYSEVQDDIVITQSFTSEPPTFSSVSIQKLKFPARTILGLFGVQYAFNKKISVFGEIGFGYTIRDQRNFIVDASGDGPFKRPISQMGLQGSGIGVLFYLN